MQARPAPRIVASMGLALAFLGLLLAAIDFFSLSERCERAAQCLKDQLAGAQPGVDRMIDGSSPRGPSMRHYFGYVAVVSLCVLVVSIVAISTLDGMALAVVMIAVMVIAFIAITAQLFLGMAVGLLHLLSLPRKGIIVSVGLLIAVAGFALEFARD